MLFVISDGYPAGHHYGGAPAEAAVREEVKKLSRKGVKTVQVAIESFQSEKMFKHFVSFTDHKTLVNDMRKLIVKVVRENTGK